MLIHIIFKVNKLSHLWQKKKKKLSHSSNQMIHWRMKGQERYREEQQEKQQAWAALLFLLRAHLFLTNHHYTWRSLLTTLWISIVFELWRLKKSYPASMNPKPRTAIADRARIVLGTLICKKGRFSFAFSVKSLFFDITVTNPPPFFTKTLPKLRTLSLGQRKLQCRTCKVSIFHFPKNSQHTWW